MKKAYIFLMLVCLSAFSAAAQTSNVVKTNLSQPEIDKIVRSFSENEKKFRHALTEYVFNRNATSKLSEWADRSRAFITAIRLWL